MTKKVVAFILIAVLILAAQTVIQQVSVQQWTEQSPGKPPANAFYTYINSSGNFACTNSSGSSCLVTGGSGTVTSVSFTGDGTVLSSTPSSAVTSSGTLTASLANAGQNTVLAGPATGGAAAPTYQTAPTFSAANLTNFPTFNQNTTGTAGNVAGTVAIANGGTGAATAAQNSVFAGPATGGTGAPSFQTAPTISGANITSLPLSALGNFAGGTVLANTTNASGNVAATTTLTLGVPSGGGSPLTGTLSLCAAASASCGTLTPVGTAMTLGGQFKAAGYNDTTIGVTTAAMTGQTTATCTTITNMSWTIAASKNYSLECRVPRTLATTATLQYCLSGPGTATSYSLFVQGANGAAGVWADTSLFAQTAYAGKTTASAAAANTTMDIVTAQIQNGTTAGTLALQTAANGTNTITVLANAKCTLTQEN